jgi:hypothetical protein
MRILRTSAAVLLLSGLGATTAGAVVPMACDTDKNGYISGSEAKNCTEQQFQKVVAGQQGLGPEQFSKAFPNVQNPGEAFKQIDKNGDGQISREEWSEWQEQSFATATAKSGSQMPTAEYQKWTQGTWTRPFQAAGQTNQ